jgi:hypothetical protein
MVPSLIIIWTFQRRYPIMLNKHYQFQEYDFVNLNKVQMHNDKHDQ